MTMTYWHMTPTWSEGQLDASELFVQRPLTLEALLLCVCMGIRVYGYMGIWVYGYMGIWVYGYVGIWVYGYMGIWVCVYMGIWHRIIRSKDTYNIIT
jgi:hypothetical protein